ncbi:AMP-binding protein [Bacillus sonorensis]|nr:AMP-binding protein [Bacillus sonorensis]
MLDRIGPDKLIHVYGPTESTVYATYYFINDIDEEMETIPIGRPLANTSALIMDEQSRLLPIGVPGELCISGDGLSTGYLNREELTAEKFIPHPFIPGKGCIRRATWQNGCLTATSNLSAGSTTR